MPAIGMISARTLYILYIIPAGHVGIMMFQLYSFLGPAQGDAKVHRAGFGRRVFCKPAPWSDNKKVVGGLSFRALDSGSRVGLGSLGYIGVAAPAHVAAIPSVIAKVAVFLVAELKVQGMLLAPPACMGC